MLKWAVEWLFIVRICCCTSILTADKQGLLKTREMNKENFVGFSTVQEYKVLKIPLCKARKISFFFNANHAFPGTILSFIYFSSEIFIEVKGNENLERILTVRVR